MGLIMTMVVLCGMWGKISFQGSPCGCGESWLITGVASFVSMGLVGMLGW